MVEPGSVFKLVTAAAALDNGLIGPENRFYAEQGTYLVHYKGLKKPRKITDVHEYGYLTFRESMEFSSNIVMAKVSNIIGNERLYRMARDFGFGMKTGVDIPAEIGGRLKNPTEWSATTRNTIAYGYEVGVTPMQVAAAYAAIANGGVLMRPFLLKKEIGPDSAVVRETQPAPVRRVVTEETAATLTSFLEGVVERGTAVTAKVPGIRIAGKTGTSKRLVDGKYAESEYTASFVGYFPAEDPRVVCLVMLDKPQGISRYGGTTSAPIFREIVSRIMASSPDFAQPASLPVAEAGSAGASGTDESARGTTKAAAPERTARERKSSSDADRPLVPDVMGYSIRRALSVLRDEKFQPVVNGSGVVVSQHPAPGEPVAPNRVVRLTCAPRDTRQGGLR
jgi:cell division protein FtsI (penicillin-binding protein 3)